MNKELLKTKLDKYEIIYTDESLDKLVKFNDMMLEYNKSHNLTSITEELSVIYKHFIDSLLPYREFIDNKKIIDIGCGGGFPSVPLSIINEKLNITAIDSTRKKTDFVSMVKKELNLTNLTVKNTRIEDLARNPDYRESFDIVISRAVAPLNTIIEYSVPLLKNNGKIVAYKGSNYKEEISLSQNALKTLNSKILNIKEYSIEEIDAKRVAIIIEKEGNCPKNYPRGQNKPRISPL